MKGRAGRQQGRAEVQRGRAGRQQDRAGVQQGRAGQHSSSLRSHSWMALLMMMMMMVQLKKDQRVMPKAWQLFWDKVALSQLWTGCPQL